MAEINKDLIEKIKPLGPGFDIAKNHEENLAQAHKLYKTLSPKEIKREIVNAMAAGLIPKAKLEHGAIYLGHCRNARVAIWDAEASHFIHMREKFGSVFAETIPHPEDDKGYDIFTPVEKL
jgi:hypothetical protein